MRASLKDEQQRVIAEHIRRVDRERRGLQFELSTRVSLLAFGLAPLVPQAERIFGALSALEASALLLPGQLAMATSQLSYRRQGSEGRAYRRSEAVECALLYLPILLFVYLSELRWSPLWALCPFTATFWATTHPYWRRLFLGIILGGHGLVTALCLLRGGAAEALPPAIAGALTALTFVVVSRRALDALLAEADRNVARAEVQERLLEGERERIARTLTAEVAGRLSGLIARLSKVQGGDPMARERSRQQAQRALEELGAIVTGERGAALPETMEGLAAVIEQRARSLCVEAEYVQTFTGAPAGQVGTDVALAAIRIVQELVRNAVTHGKARTVRVELDHGGGELSVTVRDDGGGLRSERLASATGGLKNAERWASERGGRLQQLPAPPDRRGTELRVTMPAVPSAARE